MKKKKGKSINFISLFLKTSKLRLAHQHLEQRKKQGLSTEIASNQTAIELVQCAEAHCRAFLVRSAYESTKDISKTLSSELCKVLYQLIELYAVDTCLKSIGDLLRVSSSCTKAEHQQIYHLLNFLFSVYKSG